MKLEDDELKAAQADIISRQNRNAQCKLPHVSYNQTETSEMILSKFKEYGEKYHRQYTK